MKITRILISFLACLCALGIVENAQAVMAPSVEILEVHNAVTGEGYFKVTNNSASDIYAVAVANSSLEDGLTGSTGYGIDGYDFWAYAVIDKAIWNGGFDFDTGFMYATTDFTYETYNIYGDGSASWNILPNTTDTFDTYFSGYDRVIVYFTSFNADGSVFNNPLQAGGETTELFFSAGEAGSPFVVFGKDGLVIASGEATVVPLPGAAILMGIGLMGIVGIRRKQ